MRYARMALAAPAVLALATAASAQTRLPLRTPAERQVDDINRSLMRQERNLQQYQQNQFDMNSLRNEMQRNSQPPPPVVGPPSVPCPAGSIGC